MGPKMKTIFDVQFGALGKFAPVIPIGTKKPV